MFNQQSSTPLDRIRSTLSWWGLLLQVAAVSVEVFLHTRIGHRYCRLQAFLVIPFGLAYAWFWKSQGYDEQPFQYFLAGYAIAVVIVQLAAIRRARRGDHEHTQYSGWPILLRKDAEHREVIFKQVVEPLTVLAAGMLIEDMNRPLGCYLIFASAALFISNSLTRLTQKRRVDDMRDAVFVQQQTATQFRGS